MNQPCPCKPTRLLKAALGKPCVLLLQASFGQELPPERIEELITSAGRRSRQRTTSYDPVFPSQTAKSFGAEPLTPLNMEQFHLAHKQ